jgi:glycosyltransferase involved in cell wall biosynthesis
MKVLYRIPYPYFFSVHDSVGGHIAHSLGVVKGLVEEGHSVTVLAHEGRASFERVGADFVRVEGGETGLLRRQFWLRRFCRRSKELLDDEDFSFSYTRYSAGAAPQLWWAFRSETTPNVLEVNTFGGQQLDLGILKWIDARVVRAASTSVVVSESLKTWVREHLGPVVADQVLVVPNGVGRERFRPFRRTDPGEPFRCGFAGLLKPGYGLETVIEAARLLPENEVSFHIFGAGPAKEALQEQSEDVDNFVLEGEIPFESVPDRLKEMDGLLYITSSRYAYQSPTKLLEYMAVARPIVAARTPQTEALLDHGALGYLFELDSGEALAEAVRRVKRSYGDALCRAEEAQQTAQEEHGWRSRVRRIVREVSAH